MKKISVLTLTGFLGAGKTTLLNRLLNTGLAGQDIDPSKVVVLVNEVGQIGLDHQLIHHVDDRLAVLASGCVCCSVRGELVNALRDLFMAALQRRIRPFTHVIIETTGVADPSAIKYTLNFERFLSDRYQYAGCVTVVDAQHIEAQFAREPEVLPQLAMADCVAISKTDQVDTATVAQLFKWLPQVCPQASLMNVGDIVGIDGLFGCIGTQKQRPVSALFRPQGVAMRNRSVLHGRLDVASGRWSGVVPRARLVKALAVAIESAGETLLRLKGIFALDDGHFYVAQAVHGTLYPLERMHGEAGQGVPKAAECQVVVITRGSSAGQLANTLRKQCAPDAPVV